mmetsp:Transcript_1216/g.1515  ORF Transcript_1216/g.1515 Transcript_1216/m.1515 type:complete len:1184 (-) Transcript_1216:146-3697(-)
MFGGLEVKGGRFDNEGKNENESGFSFLNNSEPVVEPPDQASSDISSLNETSGFSFMAETSSISAFTPAPSSVESGFSFLNQTSNEKKKVTEVDLSSGSGNPVVLGTQGAPGASSGFSFISTAKPIAPAPEKEILSNSSFTPVPYMQPPMGEDIISTSDQLSSHVPVALPAAGAGVTFGGASTQKRSMKRRSRAPKVGSGTNSYTVPSSLQYPEKDASSLPAPETLTTSNMPESSKDQGCILQSTKEKAEEANRRAEEFLRNKMMEQSTSVSREQKESTPNVALKVQPYKQKLDVDDEYEEAARAAKKAKAQMASKSSFAWFGGRRKVSEKNNEARSSHSSSGNLLMTTPPLASSAISNQSSHSSQIIPSPETSQHETQTEKSIIVEEEIKEVTVERHIKIAAEEMNKDAEKTISEKPYVNSNFRKSDIKDTSPLTAPLRNVKINDSSPLPPPLLPTPRQLMNILIQQFCGNVRKSMQKVAELRQQRNMLLEERFVALAKERLASQQIVQTETQQMDAAEEEDFELADKLQVVLDGHNREKAECSAILLNIGKALEQLDHQTPEVVNGVAECFENIEREFIDFKKKQRKADNHNDAMNKFASTAKQLSNEEERLKGESKQLEREEVLVKMERKELDQAIGEQTSEIEASRDDYESRLKEVQDEIAQLRESLLLKEKEEKQLQININSQDVDISKILLNFQRQITRVQKKEASVSENKEEWKNEQLVYEKLREAHEAEVKTHSEALLQFNEIMETLEDEIIMSRKFREITTHEVTFEHTREANEAEDGDLAQLQANVVKCEAAVSEAEQFVKASEESLASLDSEFKYLSEQIPSLEAEKKSAAAKRDFRTAGKASKGIKEAQARIKELDDTLISEAKVRIEEAQIELEKVQEELKEEKVLTNEKEKISGLVAMGKISNRIRALLETQKKVCGDAAPDTVKGVGALVLQGQIDALKMEGQSLGEKFGGWEEILANLEECDESADEDNKERHASDCGRVSRIESSEEDITATQNTEVDRDNIEKARDLMKKLTSMKEALNNAVADENYEIAAELDEALEGIKKQLEKLELTGAEIDLAMESNIKVQTKASENADKLSSKSLNNYDDYNTEQPEMAENGKDFEAIKVNVDCGDKLVERNPEKKIYEDDKKHKGEVENGEHPDVMEGKRKEDEISHEDNEKKEDVEENI